MDLQDLLATHDVVETINRLFIGTDYRDWAMVRDALAPRLHVDMTSLAGGQPSEMSGADLAAAWETGLKPIQAVHHQAGNYRVTVEGDEAVAFCYGTATHYRPTRSGRDVRTFVGSYDFRLARLEGKWRITSFRFNLKYVDGNLELEKD
jgi:SnoaL-like protein